MNGAAALRDGMGDSRRTLTRSQLTRGYLADTAMLAAGLLSRITVPAKAAAASRFGRQLWTVLRSGCGGHGTDGRIYGAGSPSFSSCRTVGFLFCGAVVWCFCFVWWFDSLTTRRSVETSASIQSFATWQSCKRQTTSRHTSPTPPSIQE